MKSNSGHTITGTRHVEDIESLRITLHREKEALVSMFLSNAPLNQLNEQYQKIDKLNDKIDHNTRR